jgi:predicted phage terminase large subunit-like protein
VAAAQIPPPPKPTPEFRLWVDKHLKAKYLTCQPSSFHNDLAVMLSTLHERRGAREVWLAPRGAAKTTWSTFAYPMYCAIYAIEPYTVITSDTARQARKYLGNIKRELEDLGLRGRVWRDDKIELRNGCTIEALGTGDKIRGRLDNGRRPTLIIVDDPQNKDHIISKLKRARSMVWMNSDVLSAGEPLISNVLVLGTALHREAVVCQLRSGWEWHLYRSIIRYPDNMELWADWERVLHNYALPDHVQRAKAFYDANRDAMDAGAVVLWPEREPLYELMSKRATEGVSAFASEKQNEPIAPEACEWPSDYFDGEELWFDAWPPLVVKGMALDPSKGRDSRSGDYSAYVWGGVDRDGVIYVDANLERRPITQMVEDGIRLYQEFMPLAFLVEANQFQEMLAYDFLRLCQAKGLMVPLFCITHTINKEVRIRGLSPYLAQRKIRFRRSPGCRLLVEQLRDFPSGEFDDGADALNDCIKTIRHLLGQGDPTQKLEAFQGDRRARR